MSFVRHEIPLSSGTIHLLQPSEAAELPDDGPIEWAPVIPYWSVLWRSGVALARELPGPSMAGLRVVEMGCGLAVPSLAAARAGATVLATDESAEALELVAMNARENGVAVSTARVDWGDPEHLVERGPFDLVLCADVLYDATHAAPLAALLPRLGREIWLADPGRPVAAPLIAELRQRWPATMTVRDGIEINRLVAPAPPHA